ncbi:hypothetical protein C0989_011971 [Termitomyces sp. Mn162]|nr:hypothetical protein C0989_011971 [Termitomyces sp. Mn162]
MSFVAAARQSLTSTARASLRSASSTFRAGARRLNSHTASTPKSDKPWIIGSALLFGPAFLYLISPSARKNTGHVHNDAHDFPGHKKHALEPVAKPAEPEPEPEPTVTTEPEPVLMKDDEGTEVNIADSLVASVRLISTRDNLLLILSGRWKADDVPKADAVSQGTTSEAASEAPAVPKEPEVSKDASGTFQENGSEGPTDLGEARKAAKVGVEPKKAESESS